MPISKYNQDGTVDIYNTKTGEVRKGIYPEQLSTISPRLVAEYQKAQAPEAKVARVEAEQKLKDIESGDVMAGVTLEQKFKVGAASRAVDRLEETFGRGSSSNIGTNKDLSLSSSATGLGKTLAKGEAALRHQFDSKYQEDLNIYTSALENAKGIFTQAFGQGTPQAYEAESLLQNAPGPKSTNRETEEWFKTVRSFLGQTEKKTDELPKLGGNEQGLPNTPPDLGEDKTSFAEKAINFAFGSTKNLINDIVQNGPAKARNIANEALIKRADELSQMAQKTDNQEEKKRLLKESDSILADVSQSAKEITGGFSPGIETPIAYRALGVGTELGTAAEAIPNLAKGLTGISKGTFKKAAETSLPDLGKSAVRVGEKIEENTPRAILGRRQATEAVKVTEKPIIDNFKKVGQELSTMDSTIEKVWPGVESKLDNIKDIPTLLDRMSFWGRQSYLKSGGMKSAAKAELYDALYKEGIKQLKDLAPEVYKNRALLRFTYEIPRNAGRLLWKATLGKIAFGV